MNKSFQLAGNCLISYLELKYIYRQISNIEHIFGISMIGSETAGMWQMFKGVIKSWKKLGRFPSHSFITFAFATLPPCHPLLLVQSFMYMIPPALHHHLFSSNVCSHLFLSHYIWESGNVEAQIWCLIGAGYERLPMFYGRQRNPFVQSTSIYHGFEYGALWICSTVERPGSLS